MLGRICTSAPPKLLKFLHPFKEAISKIAGQMQSDRTARSVRFSFATMVDSRKGGVMVDRIDLLTERVQVVEVKVDGLSSTVGQLSTRVDDLSTTVGELSTTVGSLSTTVGNLSTRVDNLSTTVTDLSASVAAGFVEQREYTEFSHARLEMKMDAGFARVDRKLDQLDRIERKLDQFIDVQLQTNALVERRLAER
jgi:methyl-accepting chemotaxis protein